MLALFAALRKVKLGRWAGKRRQPEFGRGTYLQPVALNWQVAQRFFPFPPQG